VVVVHAAEAVDSFDTEARRERFEDLGLRAREAPQVEVPHEFAAQSGPSHRINEEETVAGYARRLFKTPLERIVRDVVRDLHHEDEVGDASSQREVCGVSQRSEASYPPGEQPAELLEVVVEPDVAVVFGEKVRDHAGARSDVQDGRVVDISEFLSKSIDDRLRSEVSLLEVVDTVIPEDRVV
jgi:hypothetical protein